MPANAVQTRLPDIASNIYIDCSAEKIFTTLTTAAGWDAWFTQGTTLEAKVGGRINLVWKAYGIYHVDVEDGGTILALEPNKKFSFRWHPHLDATVVTFELEQLKKGTILHMTDSGYTLENISGSGGFLDCAIGWGEALALLKFYLEHGVVTQPVPLD